MKELPHKIEMPGTYHWAQTKWCETLFGTRQDIFNRNGTWSTFWCGPDIPKMYIWEFGTGEQLTLFLLKWA